MISHRAAALGLLVAAALAAPAVAGNRRGDTGTPYGDWKVFYPEEGQNCVAVQSVINAAGDDVVLMVSREPPGDTAVLSVATPPGIAIGRGLTLIVGNRQAPLRRGLTCYETNCAIQVGLDAQTLAMQYAAAQTRYGTTVINHSGGGVTAAQLEAVVSRVVSRMPPGDVYLDGSKVGYKIARPVSNAQKIRDSYGYTGMYAGQGY